MLEENVELDKIGFNFHLIFIYLTFVLFYFTLNMGLRFAIPEPMLFYYTVWFPTATFELFLYLIYIATHIAQAVISCQHTSLLNNNNSAIHIIKQKPQQRSR